MSQTTNDERPALNHHRSFLGSAALLLLALVGCGGPATGSRPPVDDDETDSDSGPEPQPDASVRPVDTAVPPDTRTAPDAATAETGASDGSADVVTGAMNLIDNPLLNTDCPYQVEGVTPKNCPPLDLKDVGIFTAIPDLTRVHARAFFFKPRHELWSNGLEKSRYLVLPEGKKIDTSKRDAWDFPVGTLMFKTFGFKDPAMGGKDRPVETRLIRRVATTGTIQEQWQFHVYEWNATATAATLVNIRLPIPRQAVVAGQMFTHEIPKRGECWNCHVANKTPIIGFDELRLNSRLEGKTVTQLQEVITKGWLTAAPAAPHLEIRDANPLQQRVLEYMHGNCAHCHNGEPALEPGSREFDLRWDKFMVNTLNIRTMTVGTKDGLRIAPGRPNESVLFLAFGRTTMDPEVKLMPPVGVQVADKAAVEMLRQWIMGLPRQ